MPEPHNLPSGFLHYCSCACIGCFRKLHTAPSDYYFSTRNFQTTPLLSYFIAECVNTAWFFYSVFLFAYFLFHEKSIFKARIREWILSETMKHFLLLPCVVIS